MENYYSLLGLAPDAGDGDIKKAFRERAKKTHPDVAGQEGAGEMRRLLAAYQVLSDPERRAQYDLVYHRFAGKCSFDYRTFLRERTGDPRSQARLIFFDLLHLEEEEALEVWRKQGSVNFPLEKYLDREDWMDCAFVLAEELGKRGASYEAFVLLVALVREERRQPYFRHFMPDVEDFLRDLVRGNLRAAVDEKTYLECMYALLGLGFPPREEARWMRSIAEVLAGGGEIAAARDLFRDALKLDPAMPNTAALKRKLGVVKGNL